MDRSQTTYIRYLRLLIVRAKTLSDRSRETKEQELDTLKRGAVTCLALLGPKVERIHRQVADLEFRRRYRAGRFGAGTIFDDGHAYETLDDMLSLLKTAFRIAQSTEPSSTTHSVGQARPVTASRTPYSGTDGKLFRLIGREDFQSLTNPELWKRYRRSAETELRRMSDRP